MDSKDAKTLNEHLKSLAKSNQQIADLIVELGRSAAKAQHPAFKDDGEVSAEIPVLFDFAEVPIHGTAVVTRNGYTPSKIVIEINREDITNFFNATGDLPLEALLISATDPDV